MTDAAVPPGLIVVVDRAVEAVRHVDARRVASVGAAKRHAIARDRDRVERASSATVGFFASTRNVAVRDVVEDRRHLDGDRR